MKLPQLIKLVQEKTGLSKELTEQAVDKMTQTIMIALINGEIVKISGLGTFEVRVRKKREYTNPVTGITILKEAESYPAFRAGKALKSQINGVPYQKGARNI